MQLFWTSNLMLIGKTSPATGWGWRSRAAHLELTSRPASPISWTW